MAPLPVGVGGVPSPRTEISFGYQPRERTPPPWFRRAIGFVAVLLATFVFSGVSAYAAETIPPAPTRYFNDYAGVVSAATAAQLNQELDQFERDTSNQIVVAIYPHLPSDSPIDDYSVRVYQAWRIGQKGRDNGALLLIYTQDHKMRIATGYGLEGALPDITCKRILDNEIAPRLRAGDFNGGVAAGIHAMIAATRGEYKGTGHTVDDSSGSNTAPVGIVLFLAFIVFASVLNRIFGRSHVYGRRGRSTWIDSPWWSGGNWGGGGGWSGGGGGGGGFSGGGGSTGGGGASGSW